MRRPPLTRSETHARSRCPASSPRHEVREGYVRSWDDGIKLFVFFACGFDTCTHTHTHILAHFSTRTLTHTLIRLRAHAHAHYVRCKRVRMRGGPSITLRNKNFFRNTSFSLRVLCFKIAEWRDVRMCVQEQYTENLTSLALKMK